MSSNTMPLRSYIEMWSQNDTTLSTRDRIEVGRTKLFDFDYPIFDPNYKKVFETHFIRHFYMREIGFETEGLFKFQLETWLLIHMPYFNKLFESELIDFDPLENTKTDVSHNTTKNENQTASGSSSASGTRTDDNFSRDIHSNNPDQRLALTTEDGKGVIEYASEITENTNNNNTTSSSSNSGSSTNDINSTEDFLQHRTGKIGVQSYSKMLNEYRDSFIRIEKQCFKEMNELFMLVY